MLDWCFLIKYRIGNDMKSDTAGGMTKRERGLAGRSVRYHRHMCYGHGRPDPGSGPLGSIDGRIKYQYPARKLIHQKSAQQLGLARTPFYIHAFDFFLFLSEVYCIKTDLSYISLLAGYLFTIGPSILTRGSDWKSGRPYC